MQVHQSFNLGYHHYPMKHKGKTAFLRDLYCNPGQIGACKIVGPSSKGSEWVIVEWDADVNHHQAGDVSVVRIMTLDIK